MEEEIKAITNTMQLITNSVEEQLKILKLLKVKIDRVEANFTKHIIEGNHGASTE